MTEDRDQPLPAVQEARLAQQLDTLRDALAEVRTPDLVEARLLREFRARQAPRPRLWWLPPLAMAATVAVVSWIARHPATQPSADPVFETVEAAPADGPFLALKPLERIALEPGARVVATEFPRAMLAQWGLPVAPERAGEPVRAELLYSAGGEPLALRLID